ncbi:hypothetical protein ABS71_13330, partial [bacterium SCN 62-11]
MTRDDGTQNNGGQPGDKDKKPKGKSSFVPRWRQNQAEVPAAPVPEEKPKPAGKFQPRWRQNTAEPAPEPVVEKKKFQARWRQNTAEPTPAPDENEARLHPNLQQQPEDTQSQKGFQPRWRQRAQEMAAKEEVARAQAPPVEDKPEFQPRWRRTAAPSPASEALPASEAPLEAQAQKPKGFQPRWRERSEREPVAPAPKAEFTPRWKRTMATEAEQAPVEVEMPPAVEVPPVDPAPEVGEPAVSLPLELVEETPEPEVQVEPEVQAVEATSEPVLPLELTGAPSAEVESVFDFTPPPLPAIFATPLALAPLEPESEPEPAEALVLDFDELVAEAEVEIVAPPPQPEKRRLPRPQAPPPPKVVAEPEPVAAPVPVPNTEDADYQAPPDVSVPAFLPGPEELEARVDVARLERAPLVETEVMPEPARKPKRLDEEAMAALKATANMVTRGMPPAAPPPAPPPPPVYAPPPPPPAPAPAGVGVAPRYTPTPKSGGFSSIQVAGLKDAPPPSKTPAKKKRSLFFWRREKTGIGLGEVATFTRQFSVMIGAGLPIHQALSFFADSSTGPIAEVMDDVATKISSGHRLSQALSKHDTVF